MKCSATIKIKISPCKELNNLSDSFRQACQYASDYAFEHKVKHKFDLHKHIYYGLRSKFNLKAQFSVNAIAKGFEAYKSCGKKIIFKSCPVRFDRRTFSFSEHKVRLTLSKDRQDFPINVPMYYLKYLDWKYQTADLIKDRKNRYFLHITFSRDININGCRTQVVGVDVGVNNLAVTSDGKIFSGHKTKIMQFQYLRKKLQAKGTKSAKRLLKQSSGRQKRYMAWVNHNISKEIVADADSIVLEDLNGIRNSRNKHMGKRLNRWLNSWSFYQLQSFIKYKSERVGKVVQFVSPYMTSQTCSNCGKIGSRYFDSFVCNHCGFSSQSDFNASFNLRRLYVTQPNISTNDASVLVDVRDNQLFSKAKSPHTLVVG
jgi:IS605 OrfB family transposase